MKTFSHLCRICIKDSNFFKNIYLHRLNNEFIYKLISKIGSLNICTGDGLPEHICSECYKKLTELLKFKVMCQNGMATLHILKTKYSKDSDVPPVAEPVQVFVDVPMAPVESSNVVEEEVDPFEDLEKPLGGAWGKRHDKRLLEREEQGGAFLFQDSDIVEGSRDVTEPQGCDDHPHEFVAYSLQSDVVISNEDGDEKPALALEAFCCSLQNCHRMFDSLDELNKHQRSCHLSATERHQFGVGGDWDSSINNEIPMVLPSESKSGEDSLRGSQWKLNKRRRSVVGDVNNKSTTISPVDGMGLGQLESTSQYSNSHPLSDSNIVLPGDSSCHLEDPGDAGAVVKMERAEDFEEDIICIDSKFFCNQCSLTFKEELSLKNHISEKHLKHNGIYVFGGKQSFDADRKMAIRPTQGVPLAHKGHAGRRISLTHNVCERSSILTHQRQVIAKTIPMVVETCRQSIVNPACHGDSMQSQMGPTSGQGTIYNPRIALRNFLASQPGKSSVSCDVCGKPFELIGDAHLERSKGGEAQICIPCVEKFKPTFGVNDQCKNTRLHQCSTCGQSYSMKSVLKRHERVHTGERPFLCNICGRTYTRSEYLKDHMKSHDLKEVTQLNS